MKEDVLVIAGVLIASAVCAWYVLNAVAGVIVYPIPTEDTCIANQCLAVVLGG